MKFEASPNLLIKLSDRLKEDNLLERLIQILTNEYGCDIGVGVEIEFYLAHRGGIDKLQKTLGLVFKKERGRNQYEVALAPANDLTQYAKFISNVIINIETAALQLGNRAIVSAKPYHDDYGSSMQFNISLGQNMDTIHQAAKSLCTDMLSHSLIFMPHKDDYLRIVPGFLSPTHISYGYNNRTTAIRIPNTLPLRLEHRVPSISADPYLVMVAIFESILFGFLDPINNIENHNLIYGNASDKQYNLTPLPCSHPRALELFDPRF